MGLFSRAKKEEPAEAMAPPSDLPEITLPELRIPEPEEIPVPEMPTREAVEEQKIVAAAEPVFVSVEDYQAVLDDVAAMKNTLAQAEEHIKVLHGIESEYERAMHECQQSLESVEKKLSYADEVLFKSE